MDIGKYKEFLSHHLIDTVNELKNVLTDYPYFYQISNRHDIPYFKIIQTKKSKAYHNHYNDILSNLIINNHNLYDFKFFGRINEIDLVELYSKINQDFNLENNTFYQFNDAILYHVCYIVNRWIVSTTDQFSIDINYHNLKPFETNSTNVIFANALLYHKLDLNDLNKNFNYTISLNCNDTNLTIYNYKKYDFKIINIIDNKNKSIKLKSSLKNINRNFDYPKKVVFPNIIHLKKKLHTSIDQKLLLIDEFGGKFIIDYGMFHYSNFFLKQFNLDPFSFIIKLNEQKQIHIFKQLFPKYNIFIDRLLIQFNKKLNHLFKLYKQKYIIKNQDLIFNPYEEEFLSYIQVFYHKIQKRIHKLDVYHLLLTFYEQKKRYNF
jgi:hypothetical protein